jgi:hypothetical protein
MSCSPGRMGYKPDTRLPAQARRTCEVEEVETPDLYQPLGVNPMQGA